MNIKFLLLVPLLIGNINLNGQDLREYVKKNAQLANIDEFNLDFGDNGLEQNDLVFFGFIHGSSTPQKLDFELLSHLVKKEGFKYYAPEVDISQAFFLNRYLETGDVKFLDFMLYFYERRVPQDASIQFREKWLKIYELNKELVDNKKIKVIGTDAPIAYDRRIAIAHLAYLLEDINTGDPMLDSLKLFKSMTLQKIEVFSGGPAVPMIHKYGGYTYDYVYPINSRYGFTSRFFNYYKENKDKLIKDFKKYDIEITDFFDKKAKYREDHIFQNFEEKVIPLIQSGEKVYSNFGITHIQQKEIYGNCYLACKIKNQYPNLKMTSISGLLAKSSVLKERNWKKEIKITTDRGLVFDKMAYKGFKTSKSWDGDGLFEKLEGINQLIKASKSSNVLFLNLNEQNSPFAKNQYLVNYSRGGKDINIAPESNTLEFFQYAILMKNSKANIPLQSLPTK